MISRAAFTIGLLAIAPWRAAAETFFVAADGSAEYATIQEAINASGNGDVIELGDGVFTGPGNRSLFIGGRRITVRSASGNPRTCTIDAEHTARVVRFFSEPPETAIENIGLLNGASTSEGGVVYAVNISNPTLRGCIIAGGRAARGGGVFASGTGLTLENCWLIDNGAEDGGGIHVTDGAVATLDGCVVAGNRADGFGGAGVWFGDHSHGTITHTTIALNVATTNGGGLFVHGFTNVDVSQSILWGNSAGDGSDIHVWDLSCDVDVTCSVVPPEGIGGYEGVTLGAAVISSDPLFCATSTTFANWDSDAFALDDASPCLPANNACAQLMGARSACDDGTPTETISWGQLKSRY